MFKIKLVSLFKAIDRFLYLDDKMELNNKI